MRDLEKWLGILGKSWMTNMRGEHYTTETLCTGFQATAKEDKDTPRGATT